MAGTGRKGTGGAGRRRAVLFGLLLVFVLSAALTAAAETDGLTVSVPETVRSYTPCEIVIRSPAAGEAELRMFDQMQNLWLVRKEQVQAGENVLTWDGLGAFGERMFSGPYRFVVRVRTPEGREWSAEAPFTIKGSLQTLVYALPSSETLYLDKSEKWFVECYVTSACLVAMEVRDAAGEIAFYREKNVTSADGTSIFWSGALDSRKRIAEGKYTVRMWSKLNPDYVCSFPLTVKQADPEKPAVGTTGPVVPERGMSEAEIWEIMMKPSVVINANGSFRTFDLYSTKKVGSRAVGTLRCGLQGLEVLETEGAWAHVRAWRHEDGKPVEGYYLLKHLTVYRPAPHYGVLIDKQEQTLTVYRDGHAIGTVPVSTGLATRGNSYRETPSGAFLTDVHSGASFAQEGFRYEYPLRYDGRYYIHGTGYERNSRVRDYSEHQKQLGQKASHGCTRVSVCLQEADSPFNMYWLWANLPYHTRIIILDDENGSGK